MELTSQHHWSSASQESVTRAVSYVCMQGLLKGPGFHKYKLKILFQLRQLKQAKFKSNINFCLKKKYFFKKISAVWSRTQQAEAELQDYQEFRVILSY